MKTKVEIADYIRRQKWFSKYLENMKSAGRSLQETTDFLNGLYEEETLATAFLWPDTPEGREYWCKAHAEFVQWLNS